MKWLHTLLKGATLSTALFIFQACYGMPQGLEEPGEARMKFTVISNLNGDPIEGVRILGSPTNPEHFTELGTTGADGRCDVMIPYFRNEMGPFLRFEDPSGNYAAKDTTFADLRYRDILIGLDDE